MNCEIRVATCTGALYGQRSLSAAAGERTAQSRFGRPAADGCSAQLDVSVHRTETLIEAIAQSDMRTRYCKCRRLYMECRYQKQRTRGEQRHCP
jgi:hypothetical protein